MDETLVLYALCGAAGGLLRDMMRTGGLVLLRVDRMADGARVLRLGFILAMMIGAGAGLLVDHHWLTAALAGWAGPDFLEATVNLKAVALRRKGVG